MMVAKGRRSLAVLAVCVLGALVLALPSLASGSTSISTLEAAGADGLSLVNTIRGLSLDERTLRPTLERGSGGYSGPALKPIALAAVYSCARATTLPIVGMGGVQSGRDALELIAAGASAVALGTVLFADPDAPARIRGELDVERSARGFVSVHDARGVAHWTDAGQRTDAHVHVR